uniref:Uncharacterized protein n=1 Tax=Anguilla anguilla TaxID=7936 RepID=A0A0E9TDY5_ANGAN
MKNNPEQAEGLDHACFTPTCSHFP